MQGQVVIATGRVVRVEVTRGTGVVRFFLGHGDPARALRVTLLARDLPAFAPVGIGDGGGYYRGQMTQAVIDCGVVQG